MVANPPGHRYTQGARPRDHFADRGVLAADDLDVLVLQLLKRNDVGLHDSSRLSDDGLSETLRGKDAPTHGTTVIKRTVFFVSDQTGITAETMGHSLMTQFDGIEFRQVTVPFISTVDKAIEAVRKIDLVGKHEGVRPIVFSTLVQEDVRNVVRGSTGFFLDFFDPFLAPLENELKTQSSHAMSRTHRNGRHALLRDAHRRHQFRARQRRWLGGARLRARRRHPDRRVALRQDADVPVSGHAIRNFRGQLSR